MGSSNVQMWHGGGHEGQGFLTQILSQRLGLRWGSVTEAIKKSGLSATSRCTIFILDTNVFLICFFPGN